MLSEISWQQYFTFLLIATLGYYAFVWIVFYKAKLSFFQVPRFRQAEDAPDEIITTAQHVINELRPLIRRDASQHEILFTIQQHLIKYNNWEEPGFRETINAYILGAFQTTCSIRLGEDDIRVLWK